jgi:hypothetical protein
MKILESWKIAELKLTGREDSEYVFKIFLAFLWMKRQKKEL